MAVRRVVINTKPYRKQKDTPSRRRREARRAAERERQHEHLVHDFEQAALSLEAQRALTRWAVSDEGLRAIGADG